MKPIHLFITRIISCCLTVLLTSIFSISWGQNPKQVSDSAFKYFIGNSEPDPEWHTFGFDDSSWKTGYHSIGFGDDDDYTLIEQAPSVYVRIPFYIEDNQDIEDLVALIDYDDGFVAYLNGIEFARNNLGTHHSETSYNQLADRSHEAEYYRRNRGMVVGYYIDDTLASSYIENGTNYLAIEVHNDSIDGSDLSLFGTVMNHAYFSLYTLYSRYTKDLELDSTHLPILKIETNEYGIPFKRIEVEGSIEIIDNGPGKYNKPDDTAFHAGRIEIEQRGESSADFPKQSFDFELQDEDGDDTSIAICGMPKENDWILQGPYADKSQIRNALIYELGRKTGHWNPRVKFVELVLNGKYLGLYNLIEEIKRDSARVNVKKLRETEISGIDLTGGYIIKYDKGSGNLQIEYPNEDDIQDQQVNYIKNFYVEYLGTLKSNTGLDPENGYSKYIDLQSFIDYTIIAELGKNCDSYLFSSYMYKDRDDINPKIQFGPLWDFDLCFGNAFWQQGNIIDDWQFDVSSNQRFNHKRLFEDPVLVDLFEDRWFELRESFLHTDSLLNRIDELVDTLSEPLKRNYEIWPIIDKDLFTNVYQVANYEEEIEHIKDWLTTRTTWIDENISSIYYPVTEYAVNNSFPLAEELVHSIYPNPFDDHLTIKLSTPVENRFSIVLIGMDGKTLDIATDAMLSQGEYLVHWVAPEHLIRGMYVLEIRINGEPVESHKILKY